MEHDNIDSCQKRSTKQGPVLGIYWLELPPDLISEAQQGHEEHGPFYVAIDLSSSSVKFEMLVCSQSNLHCSCIAYASSLQRQFVPDFVDRMLEEEMIAA